MTNSWITQDFSSVLETGRKVIIAGLNCIFKGKKNNAFPQRIFLGNDFMKKISNIFLQTAFYQVEGMKFKSRKQRSQEVNLNDYRIFNFVRNPI